jgi:hypothetical protein
MSKLLARLLLRFIWLVVHNPANNTLSYAYKRVTRRRRIYWDFRIAREVLESGHLREFRRVRVFL